MTRSRLCESCGCEPAEFVVYRLSVTSRRAERNLCEACARQQERILFGNSGLSLTDLVRVLSAGCSASQGANNRTKVCPYCGNTQDEVEQAGMVGCSMCYIVFEAEVDRVIRFLHGHPKESM